MRQDKHRAIQLRKKGKSYKTITKVLGVPKSTLAYWFKNIPWSTKIREQLSQIANKNSKERMTRISHRARQKRIELYKRNRLLAEDTFQQFKNEKLFIAGLMIYWGEGDSNLKNGRIRITNTDPLMLKLFHAFLKKYSPEICNKAKAYLILYPDLIDSECKKFWSKQIGITPDKFVKSHYINGHHPTKRLLRGICTIFISNRAYKEVIHTWINFAKKEINQMRV